MPDLALVTKLRGETICAEQRMRQSPCLAADLPERLREPAGERQVVEILKHDAVFLPQEIDWRFRIGGHARSVARPTLFVDSGLKRKGAKALEPRKKS